MGRPKRNLQAAADETSTPPPALTPTQQQPVPLRAPEHQGLLFALPAGFRNTIWIKRGGYVLLDTEDGEVRENKLGGEILNVVRDEREWRKEAYWPKEFVKVDPYADSDDEESTVGKMPPSSDEEDDEE
ncbi:hypothetical protein VE04_00028 [Pseudogymnoascus sp. 24MN13]|nr:hypothetical protein VE04_00028 [Pseudogymnoascus sp. 24MN13]